jgi:L-ascorbate metabolism protein UlaG (beta-lactamase superfamily)
MRITKLGHCCLLVREGDLTILTDPGNFTTAQNEQTGIDLVLITHEHADHFHIPSLEAVLANNPGAAVFANRSVGSILEAAGIPFILIEDGVQKVVKGVLIEGVGKMHAPILPSVQAVENTGFVIAGRLYYPGDSFHTPKTEVELLALPVAGPWVKVSDVVAFAASVSPRRCFPVHDGMLNKHGDSFYSLPKKALAAAGVDFIALKAGHSIDI